MYCAVRRTGGGRWRKLDPSKIFDGTLTPAGDEVNGSSPLVGSLSYRDLLVKRGSCRRFHLCVKLFESDVLEPATYVP